MNRSYRSNIADEQHPLPISDKEKLLVFACDFTSYHIPYIRAGVDRYFRGENRSLSYIQLSVFDLVELFGPSVLERVVMIGLFKDPKTEAFLLGHGIPFINLCDNLPEAGLGFNIHFRGEGIVAAEYFIKEAKYENLGFIGNVQTRGHHRRYQEFSQYAESCGITCERMLFLNRELEEPSWESTMERSRQRRDDIRRLLSRIPKPMGIFCGDDHIAIRTYYAAENLGIRVPEEIAILGIGSQDQSKDSWAHVTSVIQLDHQALGYGAAKLMDQYIRTGERPESVILSPSGICHGQTTFRRVVGDSLVRDVLMRIQQDPSLEVTVIAEHYKLSRKTLDIRFLRATNMTVVKAIEIERFNQAKRLIQQKKYSLAAVAAMAGYPSRKVMRRSFYRFTRMSPQEFRNLNQW